jgi:hypothetical protein
MLQNGKFKPFNQSLYLFTNSCLKIELKLLNLRMIKILIGTILIFSFCFIQAQTVKDKIPSYFGIQYKPIIPEDFLSQTQIKVSNGSLNAEFTQLQGYSFGATTRVGFTKLISFETGINQVKRNFRTNFILADSNLVSETKFGIISYDIPLNVLFYIQLSKQFYMNASLGASLVFFPSNVGVYSVEDKHIFTSEGRRFAHFNGTLNGNYGFEYRTIKYGFFYVGASAIIPFNNIYKVAANYIYGNSIIYSAVGYLNGGYLSLDLKYFFPIIAKKGEQVKKGPIQQ